MLHSCVPTTEEAIPNDDWEAGECLGSSPLSPYVMSHTLLQNGAGRDVVVGADGYAAMRDDTDTTVYWRDNPAANECQCQEQLRWAANGLAGHCLAEPADKLIYIDLRGS